MAETQTLNSRRSPRFDLVLLGLVGGVAIGAGCTFIHAIVDAGVPVNIATGYVAIVGVLLVALATVRRRRRGPPPPPDDLTSLLLALGIACLCTGIPVVIVQTMAVADSKIWSASALVVAASAYSLLIMRAEPERFPTFDSRVQHWLATTAGVLAVAMAFRWI